MSLRRPLLRGLAIAAAVVLVPVVGVTQAHAVAPGAITNLKVFTHVGAVTFSWDLPAGLDPMDTTTRTLIQAKLGTVPPATPTDGVLDSDAVSCAGAEQAVHVCAPGDVTWIDGLDPGVDFAFSFFVVNSQGTSAKVSTVLRATDLALSASATTVTYGGWTTFKAQLRRTGSGGGLNGAKVDFYVREHGTRAWYFWEEKTTVSGVATSRFRPGLRLDVQAFFYGTNNDLGSSASGTTIDVRNKVVGSVNFSSRKKGKSFTIRGTVSSKSPGSSVWIERYTKGKWQRVKTVRLTGVKTSKGTTAGNVKYTVKPKKKGKYSYRITTPPSKRYVVSHSGAIRFRVK